MATRPLRVVLAAEESAGVQTLNGLEHLDGVEVIAVLTTEQPANRRPLVHEAAVRLGLEALPPELVRSREFAQRLRADEVDLLLNVHSLLVAHVDVVLAPRIGSFNLHPGPLPEYAGLNVPSWAIYNGEQTHGVTLHWMDEEIDAGPIAWLERFELSERDTGLSVSGHCVRRGVPLVLRLVETASADRDSIPRRAQDRDRRRYFPPGPPNDGRIDWSSAALEISRFVRAADYAPFPSPWGHPRAVLGGHDVGIAKLARTGRAATKAAGALVGLSAEGALVATTDEVVVVERVFADGRYVKPIEVLAH